MKINIFPERERLCKLGYQFYRIRFTYSSWCNGEVIIDLTQIWSTLYVWTLEAIEKQWIERNRRKGLIEKEIENNRCKKTKKGQLI